MADSYGSNSLKPTGPSMSMIDRGSSGVGNYKGVMLCNRPFAGTGSASKATTHESTTFSCGLVPEKIGINVTISSKQSHKFKRPKKETVLTKHKKWLADLQKTKEALEQQYLDDLKAKEEAQKRFQEQEQRMRAMAKEIAKRAAADDAAAAAAEGKPETNGASPEAQSKDSKAGAVPPLNFKSDSTSGGGGVKFALPKKEGGDASVAESKSNYKKPVWAMSENAAKQAMEDKELGDPEGLLEFASGLNFDVMIADMEVKQLMERLKKRIVDLEREVLQEEKKDSESGVNKKNLLALLEKGLSSLDGSGEGGGGGDDMSVEDEEMTAARELLKGDEDLQAVHSTKSVAAMLRAARESAAKGGAKGMGKEVETKVSGEPLIVTHEQSEGARVDPTGKNAISNLPYMHRNPAI